MMASTNKTPNYNLPQWVASDKPERTDFNQAMSNIDSNLNLVELNKANVAQPSWIKLTVGNGWTDNDGLYYRKNSIGQVELRGALTAGNVSNVTIATLPIGFRPPLSGTVSVTTYDSSNGYFNTGIIINANGVIEVRINGGLTTGRRYHFNTVFNQ